MIEDIITLQFIGRSHGSKTVTKPIANIHYVEQLVHSVLEDQGVGPVCRGLFGLKLTNEAIWLASNVPIKNLLQWGRRHDRRQQDEWPELELRMRFRPSCFERVSLLDKTAFDVIFNQLHHDFMETRFNEEKRDFLLLNDSVLALIALNLVRHSVEQGISVNKVLKRVKPKDFIPRRAANWQRALLFRLAEQINLQKSIKVGFDQCDNDLYKIKQKFIDLFLLNVAPEYNSELYECYRMLAQPAGAASSSVSIQRSKLLEIRVRYSQSHDESTCLIETRPKSNSSWKTSSSRYKHNNVEKDNPDRWVVICDIETISHATLNDRNVQIAGPDGGPVMLQFESSKHANSFLSSIDGYHRLMRKWNFNLCREVYSPILRQLNEIGSHGPIGYETTKSKLSEYKRQGCYLVRQCMEASNRYLINTVLCNRVMLTIDIDYDPERRIFRKLEHTAPAKSINVSVRTDQEEYSSLKNLIAGTEIRVEVTGDTSNGSSSPSSFSSIQQLKYLIHPRESDHYPALLLSMCMKKLNEQEQCSGGGLQGTISQLPRVIPQRLLQLTDHRFPLANNGLTVHLATLNNEQRVVVKNPCPMPTEGTFIEFTFHYCPSGHGELELAKNLRPSQMRIADWTFVKSPLFAETIGFAISGAFVQEYFPLGRLDTFLAQDASFGQIAKLSAAFQLAQALMYLNERSIVHGKIRCRNIMVKQAHPIQVKLTDPLGGFDVEQDQSFIPPEYFSSNVQVCVKAFYTGIDVWAVGTTIWQIFNHGAAPPSGLYANTLTQPRDCPDGVCNVIETCWVVEPIFRTSPRILYRDLFDLIAWEKESHYYFHISSDKLSNNSRQDISQGTDSHTSHLSSTLNKIDSSILSSPISASSNGSQIDLLKVASTQSNSNLVSNYLPSIKRPNWTNLINLGRSITRQTRGDLPPHQRLDFNEIDGSRLSLTSCSTPTETEITKLADVMDFQSISEAIDRCVWHVDSNRLKLGAEIGRGSSGVVIKGFMSQPGGQEKVVAVKSIDKDCTGSSGGDGGVYRIEDLRREFDILKNLDHENIVKTLGYVDEANVMLIFEYMPLGSLLSCVKNLNRPDDLFELPLQKYAIDIASGMEYLESMKIVHRDLALRNILLKSRNEVKICDFGLAQSLGSSNHCKLEAERALPLKWYSPETLRTWVFTHQSDVWSYGVVLWEIYSRGDSPQYSGTYADLSETLKHERLSMPMSCPKLMYDMMLTCCWAYEPSERKTFKQIREILEMYHDRGLPDRSINDSIKSS